MSDIVERLVDLHKQATVERYVGKCVSDAIAEILRLRTAVIAERDACAKVARSHIGSAANRRKERRLRGRLSDAALAEVLAEERGEDIAAELIETAIRARSTP